MFFYLRQRDNAGSGASDISEIGKITLTWKYGAYLPTLSQLYASGLFCETFQEVGVLISAVICPGCIGLSEGIISCIFEELGRAGQLTLSQLATRSSSLAGKASGMFGDLQKDLGIVGGIDNKRVLCGFKRQPQE